jgi:hypothetical protein
MVRVAAPGSASETHGGGVVRFWAEYFGRSWYPGETKLFRLAFNGSLGADTTGLLGSLGHEASFGLRFPFGSPQPGDDDFERRAFFTKLSREQQESARAIFAPSRHAIFARLGYAASLAGDRAFYSSLVEAPRLELGYQLDDERGSAGLELRGEGGLALVGRFAAGDGARSIGVAPTYGARVVVHGVDAAHVEIGWKRIDERGGAVATPVDVADAMGCVDLGGFRVPIVRAICGTARLETGDVVRAGAVARASVFYGGVLASVSWME